MLLRNLGTYQPNYGRIKMEAAGSSETLVPTNQTTGSYKDGRRRFLRNVGTYQQNYREIRSWISNRLYGITSHEK
jgi:hypothetical protein